jgi:uroporphyrin-III C-methyltransferase/precorrin-2 dehydrogenase/sirohydrochlorin ferrochelatase
MRYFPMFIDLRGRKVVVVGGNEEALRKVRLLQKTEGRIEIIAQDLHPELSDMAIWGTVEWVGHHFADHHIAGAALVFVAADDLTNQRVSEAAQALSIPVNFVDHAELSTAITPAIVDRDPLVIAIGSEGAAPILAQHVRANLEASLPPQLGAFVRKAQELRDKIAENLPPGNRRRAFWRSYFLGPLIDVFTSRRQEFDAEIDRLIAAQSGPARGRVTIIGAGPGDPELLTLKAQRKLLEADLILHDADMPAGILEYSRRDATRQSISADPQTEMDTTATLIQEAFAGKQIVRLSLGEGLPRAQAKRLEQALAAADISFEILPGIASATRTVHIAKPSAFHNLAQEHAA